MSSSSIRKECPLCSRFSSGFKTLFRRLVGRDLNCRAINHASIEDDRRVTRIDAAAPDCACEKEKMSEYSPGTISMSERLARFVFSPMHVDRKTGNIKPSIFSHVHTKGCSIQRDSVAQPDEIDAFITKFLSAADNRIWVGVLLGQCKSVRNIKAAESDQRAVCVYDTAEKSNPAHGELCQTQYVVEEADRLELRRWLFAAFGDGIVVQPAQYRDGAVWISLPQHLKSRKLI